MAPAGSTIGTSHPYSTDSTSRQCTNRGNLGHATASGAAHWAIGGYINSRGSTSQSSGSAFYGQVGPVTVYEKAILTTYEAEMIYRNPTNLLDGDLVAQWSSSFRITNSDWRARRGRSPVRRFRWNRPELRTQYSNPTSSSRTVWNARHC